MNKGICLSSLIITIIVMILLASIIIFMPTKDVNYKAIIQVGKDEYVTVDVSDYYTYSNGMIKIISKDGRTYKTSNYTLIENWE